MNELFLVVIVQICLESLPVSSSGHILLISMLCSAINGYSFALPEHFDHFLHGPTLIILGIFFFGSWWLILKTVSRSLVLWLRGKAIPDSHQKALSIYSRIICWIICADMITVFMYGVGKVLIKKQFFIFPTDVLLLVGLCITMFFMFVLWLRERNRGESTLFCNKGIGSVIKDNPSAFGRRMHCIGCSQFSSAIILGFVQGFALIPGVSRFASTFVGARLLGMKPCRAFSTSFALLAPLAFAGFLFNGVRELIVHTEWLNLFTPGLLITIACSTIISYALFVFSYRLACAQRLWWFGFYMLIPATLLISLLILF